MSSKQADGCSRTGSWQRLFRAATVAGVVLSGSSALGDHVRNLPFDVVQPDGTRLRLLVTGDEHYRWVHDEKGRVILRDAETGMATYAVKAGGKVVPGPALVGVDDPDALGIQPNLMPDPGHFPVSPYARRPPEAKERSVEASATPLFTRINNLVIFVRFKDEPEFPSSRKISDYDKSFFNGTASSPTLKSYFLETSYRKTTIESTFYPAPNGDLVVSYQDLNKRGYYQPVSASNPDGYKDDGSTSQGDANDERTVREWGLVARAIESIASQVPVGLDIDTNRDGDVDGIVLVVNGKADEWNSLLWPHKWQLTDSKTKINGKRAYKYNFEPDAGSNGLNVGTLCHEFFHTLGAPDLYHYPDRRLAPPDIDPVSKWDLMNDHGNPPVHMGAHMKWKYGRFIDDIPWITASGVYSLSPQTSPSGLAYRINSPYSTDEYYVVEYRRKKGLFESSVPSEGLLLTRIDRRLDGNDTGAPDEVYVFRPGGTPALAGAIDQSPLSLASGRTAIGENTDPVPFLWDGSSGGLAISDVGAAGDTISFRVDFQALPCAGPVNLTSPADGVETAGTTVALSWDPAAGATSYDVYFGTSILLTEPSNVATTSTTRPIAPGQDYYWKVVARGAGGCSRSSAIRTIRRSSVARLTNGVPVTVPDGDEGSSRYFSVDVPLGARNLKFATKGGTGDIVLYVRYGQLPSDGPYDCSTADSQEKATDRQCTLSSPWAGTTFLLVYGRSAHSGVSLVATWTADQATTTPLAKGLPTTISDPVQGGVRYFSVTVPTGASRLSFTRSGGTGTADVAARYLALPVRDLAGVNSCSIPKGGNVCEVTSPFPGTYYVAVTATLPYARVAIVADWESGGDPFTCTPDATTMCLGPAGRFKVQADYRDYAGDSGQARVRKLTDLSGYFYFVDPSNVEVLAKFVGFCDARTPNWSIYASGLTDLDVTFKVTDMKTGLYKEYRNPLGNRFCTIGEGPFSCPAAVATNSGGEALERGQADQRAAALLAELGQGPGPEQRVGTPAVNQALVVSAFPVAASPSPCAPDATTMCLGTDGRFKVQADYRDYGGNAGQGKVVKLTDLSGYLTFADASSVELVAKFVSFCDGKTPNWSIYASGLTDLEVTFKVTDTKTGLYKEYRNSLGNRFCTIGDGPFTCP